MEEAIRILVVDDEPDIRRICRSLVGDGRLYRVGGRDGRGGGRAGSAAPGA